MANPTQKEILDRIAWRSRLKLLLQLGGIVLLCVGVLLIFPSSYGDHESKMTIFKRIVNLGAFSRPGAILIGLGVIALISSWLIPGDLYEDP